MKSVLFALALSAPLAAHHPAPPQARPEAPVHRVEKVAENVYCIFGQGGNIGLVVTEKHAILIDDQFAKLVPGLVKAIRSVTPNPIKYLINTHWHGDHTGGNAALEGQVTTILAHSNVRTRMKKAQEKEEAPKGGLPELTLGEADPKVRAYMALHLDGTELHLLHQGPGHTDGDLMVGHPKTHVLHMGDLFFHGMTPFIDVESGGSLQGLLDTLNSLLAWVPKDMKIIPGHGPLAEHKDLVRYRDFLQAVKTHVDARPGQDGAALDAAFDKTAWKDIRDIPGFMSWAQFFDLAAGRPLKR